MDFLNSFLSGAVVLSFLICALFFLRYWSRTRDELFLSFAISFATFFCEAASPPT